MSKAVTIILKVLAVIAMGVIAFCYLIKILVGDFHFSDISGLILPTILVFTWWGRTKREEIDNSQKTEDVEE